MPGMKRKWLWLLALAIPVIIGAGYVLVPVNGSRISQANCDKIPVGTSAEQLGQLLGACDMRGSGFVLDVRDADGKIDLYWQTSWADEDFNEIAIDFHNGRVSGKLFIPSQLSFLERIKRRIERRLRGVMR